MQIDLIALIVDEYDPAIAFFTGILGFSLRTLHAKLTRTAVALDGGAQEREPPVAPGP